MDCIVGYHLNPVACGIAKFNQWLSRRLELPVVGLKEEALAGYREWLLSIKLSEFTEGDLDLLKQLIDPGVDDRRYRLFLHAYDDSELERRLVGRAVRVYCGNAEVRARVARVRPDAIELWCPGMIDAKPHREVPEIEVFSFGMAHKVRANYYHRLRDLLDATGRSYALGISTALHENTSFEESFQSAFEEIERIFDRRVHFRGFLSDAEVAQSLRTATFFAAFFDRGVRANNTSVNAALELGAVVVTNLDDHSPAWFEHGVNMLDINRLDALPTDPDLLEQIRLAAQATARRHVSWDGLAEALLRHEADLAGRPAPNELSGAR